MKRRCNTQDIAERAGVSRTTVSFVLNGRPHVVIPEATRARVLQVADELGYRPNRLAQALKRGKTHTIGVILGRLGNAFSANIFDSIGQTCSLNNYHVLVAPSRQRPDVEAEQADLLLEHRVDGLICIVDQVTVSSTWTWLADIVAEGVPCVLVDDRQFADKVDCVISDDVSGARMAVEHLLRLGHRRIAHLSAGNMITTAQDRQVGFRAALESAGVEIDEKLIVGSAYTLESAFKGMSALLDLPEPPTAVFAANDDMAAGAWETARERGVPIPEQLALVGYGDTEVARPLRLTTVYQDPYRIGQCAVERLLSRLQKPDMEPATITVPIRLLVRESCGVRLNARQEVMHPGQWLRFRYHGRES